MAKARGAEVAQISEEEVAAASDDTVGAAIEGNATLAVAAPAPTKREIVIDKGGGQLHVTLASDEKDHIVQLLVNKKTVDTRLSVNGKVTLCFPNGWPVGDFQYKVV